MLAMLAKERGLNENRNGLLWQYFPRNMELTDVTEKQVQWAVDRLNHRPRKVLGFKTPHEVFFGVSASYTNQQKLHFEFEFVDLDLSFPRKKERRY